MKKVKLLSISIFLLLQSCITNNKNTTESNTVQSLEDSILIADSLKREAMIQADILSNNELVGKKFYYLEKDKRGNLFLEKFPQYEGDFEMPKYTFKKDVFINGNNVMEGSEWKYIKITKKDSVLQYIVKMIENEENCDTLNFIYNKNNGLLYQKIKDYPLIILIDSAYSNTIKVKNVYFNDDE